MDLQQFKEKLKQNPTTVSFNEAITVIDENYNFYPTAFTNGPIENQAGENTGSCKILAFAKNENLAKEEALACFGKFYFEDVLKEPNGNGHQNIRNFMKTGFSGLVFKKNPLQRK